MNLSDPVEDRVNAWAAIVTAGSLLHSAHLTPGTTGNVSVRQDNVILTSGTGTRLGVLSPEDWAEINLEGAALAGMPPTKEAGMHAGVYRKRPDVQAIVHLHSPAAVAVSCLADLPSTEPVPAYTPYYAMRVRRLNLVDYFPPGHPDLADAAASDLQNADALLLRQHGLVTVGSSLAEAVAAAEELEANCDLHLRLWDKPASTLTMAEIANLRPNGGTS